ncbi:MAG TPA: MMPL family transporter, partial [Candidatus Methanomethylophilaceae archaeon]|nr:MMPL family transporter [Candidatus Methanomethylophilaceae archaeon]
MVFGKLADVIMKHPKQIILAWVVIILCAVPLAMGAGDALKYDVQDVAVKESESVLGIGIINDYFYQSDVSISDSPILVLQSDSSKSIAAVEFQEFVNLLEGNRTNYKDADGNEKILQFAYNGSILSSESGESLAMVVAIYSPLFTGDDTADLRGFVSENSAQYATGGSAIEFDTYVTGFDAINYDTQVGTMNDLSKIEPVTIIMILILIGLFFRSAISAATPPITIGLAFGITLSLVFLLGQFMDIFFITEMLMLVTMMGAGCDYCIFILARYKEERRSGNDHQNSLRNSIMWAGESITISGMTVIIGFGSISLISVPMINTMGIVLALGIAIALIAALTLITSIIAVIGDKIFWPSTTETFKKDGKTMKGWYGKISRAGSTYFHKSAHFSQKYAKSIVVAAILITVPAAYVVATAETS